MKKQDLVFALAMLVPPAIFLFVDGAAQVYHHLNRAWGIGNSMISS